MGKLMNFIHFLAILVFFSDALVTAQTFSPFPLSTCKKLGTPYDTSNFYGVTAHLPIGSSPLEKAQRQFRLELLRELKVKHTREDFLWDVIEPKKWQFNTADYQEIIRQASDYGVHLLALLVYGNRLYNQNPKQDIYRPPFDLKSIKPYLDQVITLVDKEQHVYEIWNEPNSSLRFWKKGLLGQPKVYGELLKLASDHIRAKDPQAKILLGGLFSASTKVSIGLAFLKQLYHYHPDIHQYYDVLSWHPYRYPITAPDTSSVLQYSLEEEIQSLYYFYRQKNLPPKKVWITEIGWHTAPQAIPRGVSLEQQSYYLVKSALMLLSQGVERMYWYELMDGPKALTWMENGFGLYGSDHQILTSLPAPKPAFHTLQKLINQTSPFNRILPLKHQWSLPSGFFGFLLCHDANNTGLLVTWSREDRERLIYRPRETLKNVSLVQKDFNGKDIFFPNNIRFLNQPSYYFIKNQDD